MGVYTDMLATLRKGKIDTENFNSVSRKTLFQLFEEIVLRDVVLVFDEATGRVIRVAITVAILITVPSLGAYYLELGRTTRGKWKPQRKEWTMTETKRVGEEILAAAVRGLQEELGLLVSSDQLEYVTQSFHEYPSTAYHGLWSHTMVQRYTLALPSLPWPEQIKEFDDNGTGLTIGRFQN